MNCKFLQILYIEPFPKKIKKELIGKNIILVENNSTAQLGNLISEKTGIFIDDKNKILRFDGRPFLCDELKNSLKKILGSTKFGLRLRAEKNKISSELNKKIKKKLR